MQWHKQKEGKDIFGHSYSATTKSIYLLVNFPHGFSFILLLRLCFVLLELSLLPFYCVCVVFFFLYRKFASSHNLTSPSGSCPVFLLLFILSLKGRVYGHCPHFSTCHLAFYSLQPEFDPQNSTETTLSKATNYHLIVKVNGLFLVFIIYSI